MTVTIDVNVLVDAVSDDMRWHEPARALMERLTAGPALLHLFWPVVMGFVRISTNPRVFPTPVPLAGALDAVEALMLLPHVRVHGEGEGFWPFARVAQEEVRGGNDVPDAHLVALMRQHGVRGIYTRDRGFRRFDGIDVLDVV